MWTINYFPTYMMIFYWSTHVKLACLYCMKNKKVFTLINNSKTSFFIATGGFFQSITSTKKTSL
jgi:hypothetical protein